MCQPAASLGISHSETRVPLWSTWDQPMGTILTSKPMDGATMRVGGSTALGHGVAVGAGVGGADVGCAVTVGAAGGTVYSGKSSGVGPLSSGGEVGGGVGDALAAGVAVAETVGWGGAVSARTTAPASVISGAGGAFNQVHIPHPIPARISRAPRISRPRERVETFLIMSAILPHLEGLVKPSHPVV